MFGFIETSKMHLVALCTCRYTDFIWFQRRLLLLWFWWFCIFCTKMCHLFWCCFSFSPWVHGFATSGMSNWQCHHVIMSSLSGHDWCACCVWLFCLCFTLLRLKVFGGFPRFQWNASRRLDCFFDRKWPLRLSLEAANQLLPWWGQLDRVHWDLQALTRWNNMKSVWPWWGVRLSGAALAPAPHLVSQAFSSLLLGCDCHLEKHAAKLAGLLFVLLQKGYPSIRR